MKKSFAAIFLLLFFAGSAHAQTNPAAGCESLAKLSLPQAKVLATETVPAGTFKSPVEAPPWMKNVVQLYKSLPAFCRVAVRVKPSSDSDILIEV